jgi:hypothetical protein
MLNTRIDSIEKPHIPFFPDAPRHDHDDFHGKRLVNVSLHVSCGMICSELRSHQDPNGRPTVSCEGAKKKQMSQSFHPLQQTQFTCVGIKHHILSLEQSPSVQPIS